MRATLERPTPRSQNPLVRLVRGLWTLPTNALGHAAGVVVSAGLGQSLQSELASGRLYVIRLPGLSRIGGVTLGNAILLSPSFCEGLRGHLVIAHELAHTRQHDLLGPLYLPLHILAQATSAAIYVVRPDPTSDPVHAYNPLEERWLFLGHRAIDELARGDRWPQEQRDALLQALGIGG
jgi:hypothetical protein